MLILVTVLLESIDLFSVLFLIELPPSSKRGVSLLATFSPPLLLIETYTEERLTGKIE